MKKLLKASLTVMMALTLSACGGSKDVNIGIVQYAEHPALDNAKKGFLKALEDNGYGEDNVAIEIVYAQGGTGLSFAAATGTLAANTIIEKVSK